MAADNMDPALLERYARITRDTLQREQQGSLEESDLLVLITAISAGARRGLLDVLWRTPGEIVRATLGQNGAAGALDTMTYVGRVVKAREALDLAELVATAREGLLRRGLANQDISYLAHILALALLPHQADADINPPQKERP